MQVKLSLNLGTDDAKKLGLDPVPKDGDVVTVDDKDGHDMIAKGWAVDAAKAPKAVHAVPEPAAVRGVPEAPLHGKQHGQAHGDK